MGSTDSNGPFLTHANLLKRVLSKHFPDVLLFSSLQGNAIYH